MRVRDRRARAAAHLGRTAVSRSDDPEAGRQTLKEFQGFTTPDDGRKLTELYNVQHLSSNHIDPVARVTISTMQRIYSILRGEAALGRRSTSTPSTSSARRSCPSSTTRTSRPGRAAPARGVKRCRRFTSDDLLQRDKVSLDLTWLRDESLEDLDNLPPPDVIAREIVEDLEAALAEFSAVAESLGETS